MLPTLAPSCSTASFALFSSGAAKKHARVLDQASYSEQGTSLFSSCFLLSCAIKSCSSTFKSTVSMRELKPETASKQNLSELFEPSCSGSRCRSESAAFLLCETVTSESKPLLACSSANMRKCSRWRSNSPSLIKRAGNRNETGENCSLQQPARCLLFLNVIKNQHHVRLASCLAPPQLRTNQIMNISLSLCARIGIKNDAS